MFSVFWCSTHARPVGGGSYPYTVHVWRSTPVNIFETPTFSSGLTKVELLLRATLATKTKNMLRLWLGSGVRLFLSKVFFYIYVCTTSPRANVVAWSCGVHAPRHFTFTHRRMDAAVFSTLGCVYISLWFWVFCCHTVPPEFKYCIA